MTVKALGLLAFGVAVSMAVNAQETLFYTGNNLPDINADGPLGVSGKPAGPPLYKDVRIRDAASRQAQPQGVHRGADDQGRRRRKGDAGRGAHIEQFGDERGAGGGLVGIVRVGAGGGGQRKSANDYGDFGNLHGDFLRQIAAGCNSFSARRTQFHPR